MQEGIYIFKKINLVKRHFFTVIPHITFKKVVNLILNETELRLAVTTPKSLPSYIKVEPTPLCHLRCRGCHQKNPEIKKQLNNTMHLTLENLKKIIEPISDTLIGVSLSLWGEPMLNKDIISMIEYLNSKNIGVSFPSNFSVKLSEEQIERMVTSGLDSISVSLDGSSEETYSKYRVGGNFNLVLKNVKLLSEAKKKLGLKRPKIKWKFIIFDHNKHETNIVKNTYRQLGFDSYELVLDIGGDSSKNIGKTYGNSIIKNKKPCYWLWNTMVIRWDGGVRPCCRYMGININNDLFDLGNALKEDTKRIWQGEKYKLLREGFNKKAYGQKMDSLCKRCLGGLSDNA